MSLFDTPIVFFVYARPDHTRRALEALARNEGANESRLTVYSDAARTPKQAPAVAQVRALLREYRGRFGHVEIVEQAENQGLARSIIAGVSAAMARHGAAIVLEDDLETAPTFLRFMNDCVERYRSNASIYSITGFNYPPDVLRVPAYSPGDIYLSRRNCSWGWATWADRWDAVDWSVGDFAAFMADARARREFAQGGRDLVPMLQMQMDGIVDSWAIRFSYAQFRAGKYTVYPQRSFVDNIGMDGSGVHWGESDRFRNDLSHALATWQLPADPRPDPLTLKRFWKLSEPTWQERCKTTLSKTLHKLGIHAPLKALWLRTRG